MPLTLDDFDYQLPDELIARYPLAVRSTSRLLYLPAHGQTQRPTICGFARVVK